MLRRGREGGGGSGGSGGQACVDVVCWYACAGSCLVAAFFYTPLTQLRLGQIVLQLAVRTRRRIVERLWRLQNLSVISQISEEIRQQCVSWFSNLDG